MSGKSEEIVATLYNMMRLLDDMRYDHHYAFRYIQDPKIENRNYAVNWIKYCVEQVLGTDCPSTRDTSIQIFDKFLMLSYSEEPRVLDNKDYLSYAAAASVILGAKLNDTKSLLTMSKFSHFDVDRLVQFEQHVLFKTSCQVSPLCTPSNFLHYMMDLSTNIPNKSKLLYNANLLIAEFLADPACVLYAPCTVALTALLVSFSLLKIPCTEWLDSIPMYFFINAENPFFECSLGVDEDGRPVGSAALFLDHDSCIAAFEKMHYLRSYPRSFTPPAAAVAPSGASSQPLVHCVSCTSSPATAGKANACEACGDSPVSVVDARVGQGSERDDRRSGNA